MKSTSFLTLVAFVSFLSACATSDQQSSLEAKRRAALERHRETPVDESQTNLQNSQQNRLDRDSNPLRAY